MADKSSTRRLEDDQTITIVSCPDVIQVPKSVLANLSDRLAKDVEQACRYATAMGEQPTIYKDEPESVAFPALLYWAYKHELPPEYTADDSEAPFMNLWLLADYYGLPALQDTVMLELLRRDPRLTHEYDDIVQVFTLADVAGRKQQLVRFCAELIVRWTEVDGESVKDLYYILGQDSNHATEVCKAYHRYAKYGEEISDRFGEGEVSKQWWRKFMIGKWDGSEAHWVYAKVKGGRERKRKRVE